MARHKLRKPGFFRRHRRAVIATAAVIATVASAGAAYAVTIQPGQRVIAGRVSDSGHYGAYKDGSTDPGAAMWVHNYGTHCTDEGREELTALLYLQVNSDGTCDVVVEPGPNQGGNWVVQLNPNDAHAPADTPGGTTTTTAAPTTTSTTGSTTSTTAVNTGCNFAFAQTTKSVTGPCVVSGDVMISSKTSWTDNDDTTGHGFVIPAGTTVEVNAPWGAYADPRPASEVVKSMVTLGGGCADKAPADGTLDGCRVATILNLDGTVAATATMSTTGTTASTTSTTAATGSTTTTTGATTSSTTGSTSTTAATASCTMQVAQGQTVQVKPGCATIGDITSGTNVHDDDGNTFMVCVNSGSSPVNVKFDFPGEVFNATDANAVITRETNAGRTSQTGSTPCALAAA